MKRSDKVVLTTLFLAAVSSYAAKAQDAMSNEHRDDSTHAHHTGDHFLSFHHHNNAPAPAKPPTNTPRTHGFGISLRSSSSAHS